MTPTRNRAFGPVAQRWLGLGAVICAGLVANFAPEELFDYLRCPIKFATGWPCLTCGSTRAVRALSQLDFGTAFAMNPLVTAGVLGGTVYLLSGLVLRRPQPSDPGRGWSRKAQLAGLLLIVCNWIYLLAVGR